MKRLLVGAALLATVALAGCVRETQQPAGNATPTPPAPGANATGERLKIAVIPKGTTHQFWQTIKAGAEAAGKEVNAEIIFDGPQSETMVQDQINLLEAKASQGVDGIALAATDKNALVATVKDLEKRGIPVVVVDSGIAGDMRSFIATDNVAAARLAAEKLGELTGGKGKVAVLSFLKGAGTSDEREEGFLEGIKKFPGIKVVTVEYTDSDTGKARDRMDTILTQHADLAGVFASNEPNVVGAAKAIEERKLVGKVKLIGFDASDAEIEYLKKNVCQGTVVQDPFKMGYEAVKAIAALKRGQGEPQKRIDTGAKVVTPENMNTPEMEKLLYPLGKK